MKFGALCWFGGAHLIAGVMCFGEIMSSDDWYRNEDWNEAIEALFYSKQARARTKKYQYLVIQALSLADKQPQVALRLVGEYFESRADGTHDVRALLAKANAHRSLRELTNCVSTYQEILKLEKAGGSFQTGVCLEYPYLIATNRFEQEYANALNVLDDSIHKLVFPLDYYMWHAAKAIINNDGLEAQKALDAAKVKKSPFRFHPDVGLVGKEYKSTVKDLLKIRT